MPIVVIGAADNQNSSAAKENRGVFVASHRHLACGTEFSGGRIEEFRGTIDILRRIMSRASANDQDPAILESCRCVRGTRVSHAACLSKSSVGWIINLSIGDFIFLAIFAPSDEHAAVREKRRRISGAFDHQVSRGSECIRRGIVNFRGTTQIIMRPVQPPTISTFPFFKSVAVWPDRPMPISAIG